MCGARADPSPAASPVVKSTVRSDVYSSCIQIAMYRKTALLQVVPLLCVVCTAEVIPRVIVEPIALHPSAKHTGYSRKKD